VNILAIKRVISTSEFSFLKIR